LLYFLKRGKGKVKKLNKQKKFPTFSIFLFYPLLSILHIVYQYLKYYKDALPSIKNAKIFCLSKEKTYMEIVEEEHNKKMMDSFVALVELLFKDSKLAKSFLNKINLKNIEDDTEELWFKLYNELLLKEKVIELDWKEEKDIFLYSVKELSAGTNLVIDEQLLDENQNIPIWSGKLNSLWTDYVLAAMELHCDTYVLLLLTKEDFIKAQELARTVLQRIAPAKEV